MDFESLKTQVSNLTLYDIKAGVRKVQNAVMNLTEMESRVREATNADPWGAPSSLMQEIAQGTHNYQQLNEIMPMIYKRFTDKTAEEWRQIYKALQLLEFLIKNGSERVVDDARSHLSLIRMLRQFHYIDPNGKDQGINVRNRSSELAKLLSDVDQIRSERKKARSNRNKYGGVEGGAGMGFSSGSGRFGGFGSETGGYGGGGYGGEVYGDGGGFGGQDPEFNFQGTQRRGDQFEEYDEGEDGGAPARPAPSTTRNTSQVKREKAASKPKEPEQDLFDFGDEPATASAPSAAPANTMDDFGTMESGGAAADDDFDDFQSASPPVTHANTNPLASFQPPQASTYTTTSATQFAAPQPIQATQPAALNSILSAPSPAPSATSSSVAGGSAPPSAVTQQTNKPLQPAAQFKPSGPNYFTSVRADINTPTASTPSTFTPRASTVTSPTPSAFSSSSTKTPTTAANLGKPASKPTGAATGGDAFGSLWNTASTKAGVQQKAPAAKGPGMADMAKQKSSAGIWGAAASASATRPAAQPAQQKPATPLGNGLDDLLG